jgi:hypothetical protein
MKFKWICAQMVLIDSSSCHFHKYFTFVTYVPDKISWTVFHFIRDPVKCLGNALAYILSVVSYAQTMEMKWSPEWALPYLVKLDPAITYQGQTL